MLYQFKRTSLILVNKKKKTKGHNGKDEKTHKGIHLIRDYEALAVKMPKYEEYKKPTRKAKPKESEKGKKGAKKAPINVGSTNPLK